MPLTEHSRKSQQQQQNSVFTGILLIAFLAHLSTCKLEALSRQNITKGEKRIFDDILCEEIPVSRLSPNFLIPFSPPPLSKKGPLKLTHHPMDNENHKNNNYSRMNIQKLKMNFILSQNKVVNNNQKISFLKKRRQCLLSKRLTTKSLVIKRILPVKTLKMRHQQKMQK